MFKYNLLLYFLGYCVWTVHPIQVKMVPEYFWEFHHGGDFTDKCNMSCVLAENPSQPDAIFFLSMGNGDVLDAIKYETNIIKILGSMEGQHYYSLHKIQYLNQFFQGTALLDWTSDVPWLLMSNMDEMKTVEMPENSAPKITFVARNCNPLNNRMDYVKAIDKLIGVVAMSSCYHNTPWPQCEGRECTKVEAIRGYKINLAFENGNSPKYVTAKIYHALAAGVLPVWMGTRDIAEAVPKGSYIDVADFASPDEVAQYLVKVLSDDDLYMSYFEWKGKPFDKEFEHRFRVLWTVPFECRMCRYIEALQNGWEWDQIKQLSIIPEDTPNENSEGKPQIQNKEGAQIQNNDEGAPIQNNEEEAPIQINEGSALIQINEGSALIQINEGSALIQNNEGSALIQNNEGAPILNNDEGAPIQNNEEEAPIQNIEQPTPIKNIEFKLEQLKPHIQQQPISPLLIGSYQSQLCDGSIVYFYMILSLIILTLFLIFKKPIFKLFKRSL